MDTKIYNQALTELETILDLLRFGVSQFNEAKLFFGHGTDNAWDEALALTFHALHLPLDIKPDILQARLTQQERERILDYFQLRIEKRLPAPYITHEAWFAGLNFYVDKRVIIPRSPMAELIENHFQPWVDPDHVLHVLDLCAGSSCIAIAVAHYFPVAKVDAIELSDDACAVSRKNIDDHQMSDRVQLIQSDLFAAIKGSAKQYDIIVSNPPYVDRDEMEQLPPEFLHEPRMALAAGDDGLDCVRKILFQAPNYLTDHGVLFVEVGASEPAMEENFPKLPLTWLEFERGGSGVFMLTKRDLVAFQKLKRVK